MASGIQGERASISTSVFVLVSTVLLLANSFCSLLFHSSADVSTTDTQVRPFHFIVRRASRPDQPSSSLQTNTSGVTSRADNGFASSHPPLILRSRPLIAFAQSESPSGTSAAQHRPTSLARSQRPPSIYHDTPSSLPVALALAYSWHHPPASSRTRSSATQPLALRGKRVHLLGV